MGKLFSKLIFMTIFHLEKGLIKVNRVHFMSLYIFFFCRELRPSLENELSYFGASKKLVFDFRFYI